MNACRAIANAVSWHDDNKSQVATVRGSIAALVAVLCEEGPLRVLSFGFRLCEEGPLLRD